jgi:hypothetical protein
MNDRKVRGNLRAVEPGRAVIDPSGIPARQIRCRAGHHQFALDDWEPPGAVPPGVSVMFASEGRYKLMEPCRVCMAATRVTYTHPGGGIDGFLKSGILYGPAWVPMSAGQPRGRRAMRDEKLRRGRSQMSSFIGRAVTSLTAEDREPADQRPPVAPVRFRGV